jgi:hypothetical protein
MKDNGAEHPFDLDNTLSQIPGIFDMVVERSVIWKRMGFENPPRELRQKCPVPLPGLDDSPK